MNIRSLIPYLVITFGLTWGIVGLLILFPNEIESVFGELSAKNPLFILAVYAPAIAAFTLVIYHGGVQGLRRYLSRLLLWKVHWGWYAYLLIGIPVLFYAGAALKGNLLTEAFPFSTWYEVFPALAFMLVLGPIEEFGWRGLALPLLQQRYAPIWAGLMLGVIWGLWHLPAFYLSGVPQSSWSFFPFFIASVAVCVIVTPLFNASGGSILLPLLVHWQLNNPVFPDAAPYDTIMFVSAAIAVVIINRKTMFSMEGAATEVIPGDAKPGK
ncbi:MAG: CPBP family intramembrane glutamic endopeptidase [Gammaproteobacteria bacterium]